MLFMTLSGCHDLSILGIPRWLRVRWLQNRPVGVSQQARSPPHHPEFSFETDPRAFGMVANSISHLKPGLVRFP